MHTYHSHSHSQSSGRSLSGGTPVTGRGAGTAATSPRRSSSGLKTAPSTTVRGGGGGEWETGGGGEGVRVVEGREAAVMRLAEQQAMASIGESLGNQNRYC